MKYKKSIRVRKNNRHIENERTRAGTANKAQLSNLKKNSAILN